MLAHYNFYLKDPNSKQDTLIYFFCSFKGRRLKYSVGEKINPKQWNSKIQRPKAGFEGFYSLNNYLDRVERISKDIIRDSTGVNTSLSVEQFKETLTLQLNDEPIVTKSLIDLIEEYITVNKSLKKENTLKKFRTLINHLKNFHKLKGFSISFDSINSQKFNEAYRSYLLNELNHVNTSVAKDITLIKVFLNWAVKCGYSTNMGYKSFESKEPETDLIALNESELMKIYDYDFSDKPHLEAVRDTFCFSCFTGLRYSDTNRTKKENIQPDQISIIVKKTSKPLTIPLNDFSKEILKKYNNSLPAISNQKTNEHLKQICKLAGIDEPVMITKFRGVEEIRTTHPKYMLISTHSGRRTFITLSLSKGIPAELVMAITGLKTYKEFKKYVKLSDIVKMKAMKDAWNKETVLKVV